MNKKRDVVITVDKRHLRNILSGRKKIELRKRWTSESVRTIWFCEKGSGGKIGGNAIVGKTTYINVNEGWREFSTLTGVTQDAYSQYISGKDKIYYLFLENARRVDDMTVGDLGLSHAPQNFTFTKI